MVKRILPLLLLLTALMGAAQAQTRVVVGDTTHLATRYTNLVPFGNAWNNIYLQMVLTPEQLPVRGTIDTLWFYHYSGQVPGGTVQILMAETELEPGQLTTSSWVDSTELHQVMNGSLTLDYGWYPVPLSNSFHYSGTNNLVIVVKRSGTASSLCTWSYFSTPQAQTLYRSSGSIYPGDRTGTRTASMPVMRFSFSDYQAMCPRVSDLHITDGDPSSVEIAWHTDSIGTFQYELASTGLGWDSNNVFYSYDTIFSANGLSADSTYMFRVRTICDDSNASPWRVLTFNTPCDVVALPLEQSFENWSDSTNQCYYVGHNSTTSMPTASVSATYSTDSSYSLRLTADRNYAMWLALPQVNSSISGIQLSFDLYAYNNWPVPLYVGAMSRPDDLSTFDTIAQLNPVAGRWHHYEVPIYSYSGNANRLALLVPQGIAMNYFIDHLVVDYAEYCARPINVRVDSIDADSALVRWGSGSIGSMQVRYGEMFPNAPTTTLSLAADSIWLHGLLPNRAYHLEVQSDCGDDSIGWSDTVVFRSGCGDITVGTNGYIERFDGYFGTSRDDNFINLYEADYNQKPLCWDFIANGNGDTIVAKEFSPRIYRGTDTPTPNASNALLLPAHRYTGTAGQYRTYADGLGDTLFAVMPRTTDSLSRLILTFSAAFNHANGDRLAVGCMQSNGSEFVEFFNVDSSVDTTLALAPYASLLAADARIAFRWTASGSTNFPRYCCLDDIMLERTSNCPEPTFPRTATTNGFHLVWADAYSINAYEVRWGQNAQLNSNTNDTIVTNATELYIPLMAGHQYYAWVRTLCSDGHSPWVPFGAFTVPCDTVSTYPYVEDFDSYTPGANGTMNPCWDYYVASASQAYVSSSYAHSGSNSLYIPTGSSAFLSYVMLPYFDRPHQELQLEFDVYNSGAGTTRVMLGTIRQISYNGWQNNHYDTTLVANASAGTWVHVSIPLNTISNQGRIYIGSSRGNSEPVVSLQPLYIDNVTVRLIDDCLPAKRLRADSAAANLALLSWTGSASEYYRVAFSDDPYFNPDTCSRYDTCQGSSIVLQHLMPSTTYYARVQHLCGSENSLWSNACIFTTLFGCEEGDLRLDFFNPAVTFSANYMPFGTNLTGFASGASWQVVTADEMLTMGMRGGYLNGLALRYTSSSAMTTHVKIYLAHTSKTSLTVADTMAFSAMTQVFDGDVTFSNGETWTTLYFSQPYPYSGTENIMIGFERTSAPNVAGNFAEFRDALHRSVYRVRTSYTNTQRNSIDYRNAMRLSSCADVNLCPAPTPTVATNVRHNTATLHWSSQTDAVQVLYGPEEACWNQGHIVNAVGDSVVVNNLHSATKYLFFVRSICSAGDTSDWSLISGAFTTPYAPSALPYFEDFDSSIAVYAVGDLPRGWNLINNSSSYVYNPNTSVGAPTTSTSYSGNVLCMSNAVNISLYTLLPHFSVDIDTLRIGFTYSNTNMGSTSQSFLELGLIDAFDTAAAFIPVDTIAISQNPTTYEFDFYNRGFRGYNYRIAFRYRSLHNMYSAATEIDDLTIDYHDNCSTPNDITIAQLLSNGATLTWTGSAASYRVRYRETSGSGPWTTDTVFTNAITVGGLQPVTLYTFLIEAICDGRNSNTAQFSFRTNCSTYSIPWVPNLNVNWSVYNDYATSCNAPTCWTILQSGTGGWLHITNMPNSLYYSVNVRNYNNWAITPLLDLDGFDQLSFVMTGVGNVYARLSLMIAEPDSVDASPIWADYQPLCPRHEMIGTVSDTVTVSLEGITGPHWLMFLIDTNSWSFYLSDIRVDHAPCPEPSIDSIVSSEVVSTLYFSGGTNVRGQWRPLGGQWSDTISLADTVTYRLEGLVPDALYEWRLASACSEEYFSDWVVDTFRTAPLHDCFAPAPQLDVADYTSALISWTDPLHSQWIVRCWNNTYERFDTLSANTLLLDNLEQATSYNVAIAAHCGWGYYSDWGDTIQFQTDLCAPVTDVEVSLEKNVVSVTWTPAEGGADRWQVDYGEVYFAVGTGTLSPVLDTNFYQFTVTEEGFYDVYVRSICQTGVFSLWTPRLTFRYRPQGIELVEQPRLQVYPNPATTQLTVQWQDVAVGTVRLLDHLGRTVRLIQVPESANQVQLSLQDLPAGTYLLCTDAHRAPVKVVVK